MAKGLARQFRGEPLPVDFFGRPSQEVARGLLGAILVSRIGRVLTAGIIVETEAYLGFDDPASHAFRGRRHARNEAIFGPRGSWYVYRSYGIHWCCNLVADREGLGAAVLVRAVEPVAGLDTMRRRRGSSVAESQLASGPGKLCQAFGITDRLDGRMMADSSAVILPGPVPPDRRIRQTPRIGITKAVRWRLRYVLD